MMRYLNSYKKIYENKQDIDSICERYGITNYTINSDGSVDIDGDVHLYSKNLSKLPLNFNIVSGNFNCSHNQLTSLEHCPSEIGGDFSCHNNKLTSLEHCPSEVGGGFYCSYNELTSLEYCSQQIGGDFYCTGNPVDFIVRGFIRSDNKNEWVELFNDIDIIQGNKVIYDRLVWFYEEIGIRLPDIFAISSHYKIIK